VICHPVARIHIAYPCTKCDGFRFSRSSDTIGVLATGFGPSFRHLIASKLSASGSFALLLWIQVGAPQKTQL